MAVKKPQLKPADKEEKKATVLIPGKKLDPTKAFPGKGYQITGKIISEEDIKAAVVQSRISSIIKNRKRSHQKKLCSIRDRTD